MSAAEFKIQNQGFDHVEFIVRKISEREGVYTRMGFEKIGERRSENRGTRTVVYAQGYVRILLTESLGLPQSKSDKAVQFLDAQDEGVCVLAVDVSDAKAAYQATLANGARSAMEPKTIETTEGRLVRAEIWTPGNLRYAFIERKSSKSLTSGFLFDEDLIVSRLESPSPFGIRVIDHLTNNVSIGEMKKWVEFYKKVFDFTVTRHFNITTGRTGLISDVVQSRDFKITVPINEATEPASQVQEFVERLKGPGVQHLAFLTTGIIDTLSKLRANGFKFLTVPHSYYEVVPTRVPGVTEDLNQLEDLGILLDGEGEGYLLQIFSEEILGPFFFEFIQRKGNKGFGEGNFKALFEAIERDQVRRGVLSASS
ncbi:MAG: 4-hydroxyphenylpyruvate dioxygenase [Bdellovibrionales bacterium]|nr:4-hydroxyphenylpyruvate dioxygenase [Bdellovibrionales bacterium]